MANYSTGTLGVQYGSKVFINISENPLDPSVPKVWAEFGDGINNLTENLNENVIDSYYLINHGWGNSEVTAMHPEFSVSGVRMHGDAAQDWIFKRKFKMLDSRKTQMKVQVFNPDNPNVMYDTYQADITITNLQEISGATEAGNDISMTLKFNGSPTPQLQTPIITLTGNRTSEVKVEIEDANEDALIYYTTNGDNPTTESTLYTGEFNLTEDGVFTIKAICTPNDPDSTTLNSDIVAKTAIVVLPSQSDPEFEVTGDNTSSVTIELSADEDADIYYTYGSTGSEIPDPTSESTKYESAITNTTEGSYTYKAIAIKNGYKNSNVVSQDITVTA